MLFYSYFKTLVGKEVSPSWLSSVPGCLRLTSLAAVQVTIELKNDLQISGTLHSVDQYLNIKLHNTKVLEDQKYPHLVSC